MRNKSKNVMMINAKNTGSVNDKAIVNVESTNRNIKIVPQFSKKKRTTLVFNFILSPIVFSLQLNNIQTSILSFEI